MRASLNPFSRILNTPQSLIRNIPQKRASELWTVSNVTGLGELIVRRQELVGNCSCFAESALISSACPSSRRLSSGKPATPNKTPSSVALAPSVPGEERDRERDLDMHMQMYMRMYLYMYRCICTYMYVCIYIYMYTYIYICVYAHRYICTYVYMYTCMYAYIYIYVTTQIYHLSLCISTSVFVSMYLCIHVYTHMQLL